MFISITTDFICARQIDRTSNKGIRQLYLTFSILINLSILCFFKYFNFFSTNITALLKDFHLLSPSTTLIINVILPLGISFYTFEAISYTVDVYRGIVKPARKYVDYLLFVIYFPHLIAGPIMRAKSFLPQITTPRKITLNSIYEGSFLFFWGLFEKMFVADNLAKIVNPVFASSTPYEGGVVLMALYGFAFQIFCDFDGYSNMARGLGLCMGFDITINFKLPYFAINPKDFWQRWHISLSSWLRDYIYIPLGGNRNGKYIMYKSLLITMILGGLWHGAGWTFLLWGFYHGLLLVIYRIGQDKLKLELKIPPFIKTVIFFHLILFGWLLFRAQSIHQVLEMFKALVFNFKFFDQNPLSWLKLLGFISPLLIIQIWQYKTNDLMVVYKQHWLFKTAFYAFLSYLLIGWGVLKAEEFIYFQF